jgi:hypothetical protein
MAVGTLKGGKAKGGGGSDPAAEAESCWVIWVRSWLVVSAEFLIRYLYPSMINAATVAEKRPVCRSFFSDLTRSRRYERTHEDEDAIHVSFPTLYQRLVILLTLLEDNGPELRGRIHVLDVCDPT